jgi:hypothetical protein
LINIRIVDNLPVMNDYQSEQLAALRLVRSCLPEIRPQLQNDLHAPLAAYLHFREETDRFLEDHFGGICSRSCYQNRLSACCSKDGIITFFADVVVNALHSDNAVLDRMDARLQEENAGAKCIYLSPEGCLWRIKPVVCQMFLCNNALKQVFGNYPDLERKWDRLKEKKKGFTWPDKPVLFDGIEALFLDAGHNSSLMYCHNSPGLVRLKKNAGLLPQPSQQS